MQLTGEIRETFLPTGVLRASINLGNPILAGYAADGTATGVSVDLADQLAERLGAALELVVVDAAGKSVATVTEERADVGFFAIDPLRGNGLHFTRPYVLIEQVDRAGTSVMVGKGSAYDLYLTRELKQAQILRAPTSPRVVEEFLAQGADVAAGVRQQLEADAAIHAGLRLLPGRFMVIEQAMGMPRSRCPLAAQFLAEFVEDMKRTGFVADALRRHGIQGARVAPAQPQ
jgi:polar amino acid transport system substrate-binding protein